MGLGQRQTAQWSAAAPGWRHRLTPPRASGRLPTSASPSTTNASPVSPPDPPDGRRGSGIDPPLGGDRLSGDGRRWWGRIVGHRSGGRRRRPPQRGRAPRGRCCRAGRHAGREQGPPVPARLEVPGRGAGAGAGTDAGGSTECSEGVGIRRIAVRLTICRGRSSTSSSGSGCGRMSTTTAPVIPVVRAAAPPAGVHHRGPGEGGDAEPERRQRRRPRGRACAAAPAGTPIGVPVLVAHDPQPDERLAGRDSARSRARTANARPTTQHDADDHARCRPRCRRARCRNRYAA